MKNLFLGLILILPFIGYNSDLNFNYSKSNSVDLIKENQKIILNYNLLKNKSDADFFPKTGNKSNQILTKQSGYILSQEKLEQFLSISTLPENVKESLNLSQVNNIIDKVLDLQIFGNLIEGINKTSLSLDAKKIIFSLLRNKTVQNLNVYPHYTNLPQNEKETLDIINQFTNDYFLKDSIQSASLLPDVSSFVGQNITGIGANGDGIVDYNLAGLLTGAIIGGSSRGNDGALVGALIGFTIGESANN